MIGRYGTAVNDLKSVLSNTDGIPASTVSRAHFRLARCYFEMNSYDEAKAQMEDYDKSMDSTTISISQPAVTKLKRDINDKRNGIKNKGKKPQKSKISPTLSHKPPRPITYEAKVLSSGRTSFFIREMAPAFLCVRTPPQDEMQDFLLSIVERHYGDIFYSRPSWSCWICGDHSRTMLHLPAAYLHLPTPLIVDLIRPVCGRSGVCDSERLMDSATGRMLDRLSFAGVS